MRGSYHRSRAATRHRKLPMSCQRAALCAYSSIFRERQRSILVRLKDSLTARNEPLQRYVVGVGQQEVVMGFGRGALLWLLGIPIPIIILIALFMHH